jgi:hypothetical protein
MIALGNIYLKVTINVNIPYQMRCLFPPEIGHGCR